MPDATQQVQLNLPDLINQTPGLQGSQVQAVNPDGSASLRTPDGKSIQFNPIDYAKQSGIDPMKMKVQYNTPDTAIDDNPIGFKEGLSMAMADAKGQGEFLLGKYGQGNVVKDPNGQFIVNDNGTWKKANPGFLANLAASSPEIAASIEGTAQGTALGLSIAGPIGAVVGGIGGGATAAALATVVKDKGASALNMRSQMDAKQALDIFGHETVNNLIWGTVLAGTGKVLGMALKPNKAVVRDLLQAVDKDGLADMGTKMIAETAKEDWLTTIRSAEDGQAVYDGINKMVAFKKAAADKVLKGPDPMTNGMISTIGDFMDSAKESAEKMYGDMWGKLDEAGVTKSPVNVADTAAQLKTAMQGMGLIDKDPKTGEEFFNGTPISSDPSRILQVFDSNSKRTIKAIYDQISNVAKNTGGEVSFDQARGLVRGVDQVLEQSGFYKNGGDALTSDVRRALGAFREGLDSNISDAIKDQVVASGGRLQNALDLFKSVNGKYSQYRSVMNDFALPNKFGGDIQQMANTTERMLGPKGLGLEDQFTKLGGAVGQDAEPVLQKLQQMRAAKNLSPAYTPNQGKLALMSEIVTGGPRRWAKAAAQATIDQAAFSKAWNESLMAKIPASGAQTAHVEARAQMVDYINKLSPQDRMKMLTNPIALRNMIGAVESTPQLQQSVVGQMLQPVNQILNRQTSSGQ